MEANVVRFASVLLLLLAVVVIGSALEDGGYGKSQAEGYVSRKPDVSKERSCDEKLNAKTPGKPVISKGEYVAYEKSSPKIPVKPVMPKEEHVSYGKSDDKLPTKRVLPKEEHHAYEKTDHKLPSKPVVPKEEHGAYEKSNPELPTKPVSPKPEKPLLAKALEHPKNIAVQGLVYCKHGSKLIPLQGTFYMILLYIKLYVLYLCLPITI